MLGELSMGESLISITEFWTRDAENSGSLNENVLPLEIEVLLSVCQQGDPRIHTLIAG